MFMIVFNTWYGYARVYGFATEEEAKRHVAQVRQEGESFSVQRNSEKSN